MTRDPTRLREALRRAPRPLEERQARAYDEEIHPLWGERFANLQLAALEASIGGAVLEVGCGAGAVTAEIVARHRGDGRVVAVDAAPAMLERARARVGSDRQLPIFFRPHDPTERLPFAEETFDLVLGGPALETVADIPATIADLVRVTVPGGRVVVAMPLGGTWGELLDLFAEVLRRPGDLKLVEGETALADYRASMPDGPALVAACERAGLVDVELETTRWELLFRSGREFFYAPLIETGPLPVWRAIAAMGGDVLDIFVRVKDAIDTDYARRPFAVSVIAGRVVGYKPPEVTPVSP